MKVIDLLNKIAKGEKVPKKIKFNNHIFNLDKLNHIYISEWGRDLMFHLEQCREYALTEEIKITEEEKEIEELNLMFPICDDIKNAELGGFVSIYKSNLINIKYKIDEIIDELNKIKKEGK